MTDPQTLPPFLRCPLEIRLQVYRHLLVDTPAPIAALSNLASVQHPDYYEYEKLETPPTPDASIARVLCFRNVDHTYFSAETQAHRRLRSSYKIRSDRFRNRCVDVTYHCVNTPDIHPAILGVSRQLHEEAARLLYTSYAFDFDTHVEACAPFLGDLSAHARGFVRRISVVKKALPYDKDFDRCEWSSMCKYLAEHVSLAALSLGVVAGKPAVGWDLFEQIPPDEFHLLVTKHRRDEMQWVRDLLEIKGLQRLDVRPCVEHCPAPGSNAMMFFVAFSASVETGFTDYLTKRMLGAA